MYDKIEKNDLKNNLDMKVLSTIGIVFYMLASVSNLIGAILIWSNIWPAVNEYRHLAEHNILNLIFICIISILFLILARKLYRNKIATIISVVAILLVFIPNLFLLLNIDMLM